MITFFAAIRVPVSTDVQTKTHVCVGTTFSLVLRTAIEHYQRWYDDLAALSYHPNGLLASEQPHFGSAAC